MDIDDEWELDSSSSSSDEDDDEAAGRPVKVKEEVLSESDTEERQGAAALDPDVVIKVEKLDPELDSWPSLTACATVAKNIGVD